jgi:Circularly permutated YpsA SLOG family
VNLKIISGGQTGVDRAALDVAIKHRVDCGGWCPAGRLDEFGRIPDRYPVKELEHGGFEDRTRANVRESDATVAIYSGELRGGTAQTVQYCIEQKKPHQLIDAGQISPEDAAQLIVDFVHEHKIEILNVAGPRESQWAEGYDYSFRTLDIFLTTL